MSNIPRISVMLAILVSVSFGQPVESMFSDIRGYKVGDLLSVIIVEQANATRESKSNNKSQSSINTDASLSGDVTKTLPSFGLSSNWSNSYDGHEGTEQKERLSGRLSVKIVDKTEAGMLRIEGERVLEVNGEENVMLLTGLVRPRDINSNNTVLSYNIAEAKITYKKGGLINSIAKPGVIPTVITSILGLALLAVGSGLVTL